MLNHETRGRALAGLLAVTAIVTGSCSTPAAMASMPVTAEPAPSLPLAAPSDSLLWMEMRNVDLHVDPRNVMHVRTLRGQVVSTEPGTIAWLDKPTSFHVRATSGSVALDGDAVTALLSENAFNYPTAPIKGLRVRIENGEVIQSGTLHKGVDIAFTMWSKPVLLADGRIKLTPDRLTILGVNGLSLMHALHLHLDSMMDLSKAHGVSVKGDDLFLDPLAIIPPPTVAGHVSAVRVEGALLAMDFAHLAEDSIFGTFVKPDSGSKNFVYFRGGNLRFGKLTMNDTDLLIHDNDESDPFDLYFAEYNKQLVAGHTKNLENFGLRTWMVDYAKLARGVARR